MTKISIFKASTAPLALGLALAASPAFAQDEVADAGAETTTTSPTIVVTGSRIANPNLKLSSPVSFVTEEELTLRQTNTAEQFLRELPSAVPSIGSAVNNGNGGASFVNLRGVGSNRNLVLLDGRRFVPADESGQVDLNNIPLAVIERTDIFTGGATTTYGADAVSGVINFITKKDFAGVELNTSTQITEEGDGEIFRSDLTIGANFDDGRGNAVLSIGYQDQKAVFQGDRPFSEFNVGSFSGNAGGSSAAVPAFIVGPPGPGAAVVGQITPDGTDIGAFDRPFNFNPFNIFQTPFERYNIFSAARYEISPAVEVYSQAVFSKQTVSTIIAPGGSFFNTYSLNLNNPFIPDAIAQRFGDRLGLTAVQFGAARNTQFGPTLADGSPNPDFVEFSAQVRRRSVEAGTRNSDFTTTLFNLVVGARGEITDNIRYDVSATYGESERIQRQTGFARFNRLQQSLLAIPDGSGGAVCIDASDGCAAINLFGTEGNLGTPEAIGFVFDLTQQVIDNSSIATVNGAIDGDIGWGISSNPISFAVGVEYREFKTGQVSDEASQTPGAIVGGGGADPNFSGQYDVLDLFGEVFVPVLEDVAFAKSLSFEAGIRYSDYQLSGKETTWKVGGSWEPVDGVKVRGNFQKAARAPNIGELFFPVTTGLDNLSNDPCAGNAPVVNAQLAAVCIAQGAPAAIVNAGGILNPAAGQINVTGGGNINLQTEEAETYTAGVVLQPAAVPGLAVTIDYFNIKIEDAVSAPSIGDIINGCYGTGNLSFANNPFCQLVERSSFTGGLDGAPNEVRGLLLNASNLGLIKTDGIDFTVNYRTDVTDKIGINLNLNGTWTNKNTFKAIADDPNSINRDCVGFFSVNCGSLQPEWAFDQRTTVTYGDDFSFSVRWRYIDSFVQEPLDVIDQGPAFVGNTALFGDVDFTRMAAQSYFDLAAQWDVAENILFTFTVQNALDNKPPIVGSDIGTTAFNSGNVFPSTHDTLGRRYGVSVKLRF